MFIAVRQRTVQMVWLLCMCLLACRTRVDEARSKAWWVVAFDGALARVNDEALALAPDAASQDRPANPPLFRVRSKTTDLYLLGSIHVGKAGWYPLGAAVESAFADADVLVVEVVLDSATKWKAQSLMTEANYPAGDGLSHHVAPSLHKRLSRSAFLPMPMFMAEHLRPWVVAMAMMAKALKDQGYDADQGIDQYFMREAERGGKPMEGLESIEQQLRVFSSLSDPLQAEFLTSTLDDIEHFGDEFEALARAYRDGDDTKLAELTRASLVQPQFADLMDRLLSQRNRSMAAALVGMLSQRRRVFAVVGAAHVVGDGGIVDLLRQKGFAIERLAASG